MKKKDRLFHETYKIDESTNLYMIEIALNNYSDIFNEWDPSPFQNREVEPDLEQYLVRSSEEIPIEYPIELCISVPKRIRDVQIEEQSQNGLKNHFAFKVYILKKRFNQNNQNILLFSLFGCFLIGMVAILKIDSKRVFPSILEQGLLIGGWVFLWEAISRFFFRNREFYETYKTYTRLLNAPVIFRENALSREE